MLVSLTRDSFTTCTRGNHIHELLPPNPALSASVARAEAASILLDHEFAVSADLGPVSGRMLQSAGPVPPAHATMLGESVAVA